MPSDLTILQQLVFFTFTVSYIGFIGAAFFFAWSRDSVPDSYRSSMVLSAVIFVIAAINYHYMREIYLERLSGGASFPTPFRYIDWILTVPLMLVKFPALLGLGRRGMYFLIILVVLSLLMLITGYVGEITARGSGLFYTLFAFSCTAWGMIIAFLFFGLSELPPSVSDQKRAGIRRMALFVLIGWSIYPIGFLMPSFGLPTDVRELIYNVGDLVNKIGLGLVVLHAAAQERRAQSHAE